jgi:RNA polymerase sigma factor (sigma-70 family)
MEPGSLQAVVSRVRRVALAEMGSGPPDAELLGRFVAGHDEAAFAELVRRYGGLVRGVCRRLLDDGQDVEDASQATFLILARDAGSIRKRASLTCWLHGVALRVARRLREQRDRRRAREAPLADVPQPARADEVSWREVRTVLDEEMDRLPEELRGPLVLCYLRGLTRDEAARELGWAVGRLKFRLQQARQVLRHRLLRRGVTPSVPLLALLLSECGEAASAVAANVPAALALAHGRGIDALVPATVAALVRAALPPTCASKSIAVGALLTVALAGVLAAAACLPGEQPVPAGVAPAAGQVAGQPPPAAGAEKKPMSQPQDLQLLQGDWELIRIERGGKPWNEPHIIGDCAIDGNKILLRPRVQILNPDKPAKEHITTELYGITGTFTIDPTQEPRRLTIKGKTTFRDLVATFEAIYKLEGNLLTIMLPGANAARPVAFETAEDDGDFRLLLAFRRVFNPKRNDVQAEAAAYHPDGTRYARAWGGQITVHDDQTGKELLRFAGAHGKQILHLAFSPDGETLASVAARDTTVKLWNVRTGQEQRKYEGHAQQPLRVAFVGDGKLVASASGHGLWEAARGKGQLKVWEAATGKAVLAIQIANVLGKHLAFSGDGRRFAAASPDRADVKVWDLPSGKVAFEQLGAADDLPPPSLVALSADGCKLATFQPLTHRLGVYNIPGDQTSPNLTAEMTAEGLAFSPTGEVLVWGGSIHADSSGRVENRAEYQIFFPAEPKRKPIEGSYPAPLWSGSTFNGAAFRPDGRKLLLLVSQHSTAPLLPADPAPKPKADELGDAFEAACQAAGGLEQNDQVLQGLAQAKRELVRDADGVKSASFHFEQNTKVGAKSPPLPQDSAQPHFYLDVALRSGEPSQHPPANLLKFRAQGRDYYLVVTVAGSDAELVQRVRMMFQEALSRWTGSRPPGGDPK